MSGTTDHGPRTPDGAERLWTYDDLARRWSMSPRNAQRQVKRMGIRPVRMGHKMVRFRPCSVMAAEERAEMGPKRTGFLA